MDQETQRIVTELRELCGLDVEPLVKRGLLPLHQAKKWLVKELYFMYAREGRAHERGGRNYTDIKMELSESYGVSVSTIEKMVYRRS